MDFLTPDLLISLLTLTLLEIVLGIDNVIFVSIIAGKLPKHQQGRARTIGLSMALLIRIALLFTLSLLAKLTGDLFNIFGHGISIRDLIMICGGLFLLTKSTTEIHHKLEGEHDSEGKKLKKVKFSQIIFQIILLDIVFSFDSIITAIGLASEIWVMITAVVISLLIMLAFSGVISDFINKRPTMKVLALSFLLMIGMILMLEGFEVHVPKEYVYFAMAFSFGVEILNLRMKKKSASVNLRERFEEKE